MEARASLGSLHQRVKRSGARSPARGGIRPSLLERRLGMMPRDWSGSPNAADTWRTNQPRQGTADHVVGGTNGSPETVIAPGATAPHPWHTLRGPRTD